jgi:hypothetical protein
LAHLTCQRQIKGRALGVQSIGIGNIKVQMEGYPEREAITDRLGEFILEAPDNLKSVTLNVINDVNHFNPLVVDLNDDIIELPDWKAAELSLCGFISIFDEDLNL